MQEGVKHLEDAFPYVIIILILYTLIVVVKCVLEVNHQSCRIALASVQGLLLNEARPSAELIYNLDRIVQIVEYESLRRPQGVVSGLAHIWVFLLLSAPTFLFSLAPGGFLRLLRSARC